MQGTAPQRGLLRGDTGMKANWEAEEDDRIDQETEYWEDEDDD
jgi:hypothetical protein